MPFVQFSVTQTPWMQEPPHGFAQLPQWATDVVMSVSQPVDALLSQSPNPAKHVMTQVPFVQLGLPFVLEHALPQAPQLSGSASVGSSQPFDGSPSQSANPAMHWPKAHWPAAQIDIAFGSVHGASHVAAVQP